MRAKKEFQKLYSDSVNSPEEPGIYILRDIPGEELSLVIESDEFASEIHRVKVIGWYLYREKYLIGVSVENTGQPGHDVKKSDVINSFNELVKCAKEVVDKREGVN